MINKIKDIPYGTEVWVRMRREKNWYDKDEYIRFRVVGEDSDYAYLNDSNEVLTEEQMRERFSKGFPPKKIQKTLAELEKELGYEEGTIEITN